MVSPNYPRHPGNGHGNAVERPQSRPVQSADPHHKPIAKPIGPELAAIWQASKAAVAHGRTVAQVGWFHWKVGVRARVAHVLFVLTMAITMVAVAVTMAVWSTSHLLAEISAALGGGLPGCLSAIAIMFVAICVVGAIWHSLRTHARSRKLAQKLTSQPTAPTDPDSEYPEVDRLRRQAITDLRTDQEKIREHASTILRQHPIAALSASAASGLVVTRVLMAMPRTARRGAIGALRLSSSVGLASLFRPAFTNDNAAATTSESSDQESA